MTEKQNLLSVTFWSFLLTQFLGAFNDNYFKQMVLLTCVSQTASGGHDYQPVAQAAFALPFVLLSGIGGYLSDRFSKQRIIVLCKVFEIVIMMLSLAVLVMPGISAMTQLMLLIGVLSFMGGQSAIFGPSKYGSLPELFRREHLLPVNGSIQMTTFLAIIFGMVCAGVALDQLNRSLWLGSIIAVMIAAAGTITSFGIRRTPAAQPELPLRSENFMIPRDIIRLLRGQHDLLLAVGVVSVFWFVGGVVQPTVNALGVNALGLSDTRTSLLAAGMGTGIAAGCLIVGVLGGSNSGRWVRLGARGIVVILLLIAALSTGWFGVPSAAGKESLLSAVFHAGGVEWTMRLLMVLLGMSAGVFVIPVQVYVQRSPPAAQKGRVIGVLNLINWIGILMSAVFLGIVNLGLVALLGKETGARSQYAIFIMLAIVMLPVATLYRLPAGGVEPESEH